MRLRVALAGLALLIGMPAHQVAAESAFARLAEEVGIEFSLPDGLHAEAGRNHPLLPYELTLKTADSRLEARYALRPLGRLSIEYRDPHNAAPEPEHLYPLMFASLVDQLSVGGSDVRREYPPEQARERFGADWAAAAMFDVRREFTDDYDQALLLALHRQRQGEVYIVALFDDPRQVRMHLDRVLAAIRFTE